MNEEHYFVSNDGETHGPFTLPQLRAMWKNGTANALSLYYTERNGDWRALPQLAFLLDPPLPSAPQTTAAPAPAPSRDGAHEIELMKLRGKMKSKAVAVLLALFLPFLGCFYAAPLAAILTTGFAVFLAWWFIGLNNAPANFAFFVIIPYVVGIFRSVAGVTRYNARLLREYSEETYPAEHSSASRPADTLPVAFARNTSSIEGASEEDIKIFAHHNASYYVQVWRKQKHSPNAWLGKRINWPAFFFGAFWLAYRKMYLFAFLFFILALGWASLSETILPPALRLPVYEFDLIAAVRVCFYFFPNVILAAFGNVIYLRRAEERIVSIKNEFAGRSIQRDTIAQLGGVNRWAKWLPITFFVITPILVGFALPMFGSVQEKGALTKQLSNAKQIATACTLYAADNNGDFPSSLEDLVPDYLPDRAVFNSPFAEDKTENSYEYAVGLKDTSPPKQMLIRDKHSSKNGKRVVAYVDMTGEVILDPNPAPLSSITSISGSASVPLGDARPTESRPAGEPAKDSAFSVGESLLLTRELSVATDSGVVGFRKGTRVVVQRDDGATARVGVEGYAFDVPKSALGQSVGVTIVNGGFEAQRLAASTAKEFTSMPGWTIKGSIDVVNGLWSPFEGQQVIDLVGTTGPGTFIEQKFSTVPGQVYRLAFRYGNNPDTATATGNVTLTGTAQLLSENFTHAGSANARMGWVAFGRDFTADSATTTLRFTHVTSSGAEGRGIVLDAVEVESVTP